MNPQTLVTVITAWLSAITIILGLLAAFIVANQSKIAVIIAAIRGLTETATRHDTEIHSIALATPTPTAPASAPKPQ